MENDKNDKTDKIIGWLLWIFLSVVGSTAICGFTLFLGALASITWNWTYGIIFVVMFIILMRYFLRIANGTVEDDDDGYYRPIFLKNEKGF